MRLYGILKKLNPSIAEGKALTMPRVITICKKCVEHGVQDCLIQKLHFNDLYVLLLSFDIANIKQAIKTIKTTKNKNTNNNVRDISADEAVKFLKGGGQNG